MDTDPACDQFVHLGGIISCLDEEIERARQFVHRRDMRVALEHLEQAKKSMLAAQTEVDHGWLGAPARRGDSGGA